MILGVFFNMDYEILFYMLIAFIVGRLSKLTFYIGPDDDKYNAADFGIKLRE